jgi:hypothetical protein
MRNQTTKTERNRLESGKGKHLGSNDLFSARRGERHSIRQPTFTRVIVFRVDTGEKLTISENPLRDHHRNDRKMDDKKIGNRGHLFVINVSVKNER